MRTVRCLSTPPRHTAARQLAKRIFIYFLLAAAAACILLLHSAAIGHPLLPLASAAPLIVSPATVAQWRAYVAAFDEARHRAGGYDEMRAAAAGLLGTVQGLLAEYDARTAQRDTD